MCPSITAWHVRIQAPDAFGGKGLDEVCQVHKSALERRSVGSLRPFLPACWLCAVAGCPANFLAHNSML